MLLVPEQVYQQHPLAPESTSMERLDMDVILSAIPKNFRTRARALLNHITADPEHRLQWNERGELVYYGKVITGSHITDLLKNSQRQYRHSQPVGHVEFQKALNELNIPIGLMETRPGPPGQRLTPQNQWLNL